jgi:hypothetical protein
MAWHDLREKYGNAKSRDLLNRAVRAEVPGGGELIDACHRIRAELERPDSRRTPEDMHDMRKSREAIEAVLDRLREGVCRRWGIRTETDATPPVEPTPAHPVGASPVERATDARTWTPPAAIVARMGHESDVVLAQECGVSTSVISRARDRLGIPAAEAAKDSHRWTPAMDKLLGQQSDGDLATKWGMSAEAVRRRREKLGIASTRPKVAWTDDRLAVLARETDNAAAAKLLGISETAAKVARSRFKDRLATCPEEDKR